MELLDSETDVFLFPSGPLKLSQLFLPGHAPWLQARGRAVLRFFLVDEFGYPVVNGGSDSELGVPILPIYSLFNGEPRSYLEFPSHPMNGDFFWGDPKSWVKSGRSTLW